MVEANDVAPPVSVGSDDATTCAFGAVVPVTVVVPLTDCPEVGDVIVVGTFAGGACVT